MIIAELILHGTLWYLTGGSVYDIQVCALMSKGYFFRAIERGIDSCPMLQIKFPVTLHDLTKPVNKFYSLSADGIMNGCVGDLDGWLARCPSHL